MKTRKVSSGEDVGMRPALSPEARENQMISLAMDLVEKRLREGTASSAETTHSLNWPRLSQNWRKRSWKKKTNFCGQRPKRCRRRRTPKKYMPKPSRPCGCTTGRTKKTTAMISHDLIAICSGPIGRFMMIAALLTDETEDGSPHDFCSLHIYSRSGCNAVKGKRQ